MIETATAPGRNIKKTIYKFRKSKEIDWLSETMGITKLKRISAEAFARYGSTGRDGSRTQCMQFHISTNNYQAIGTSRYDS